MRGLVVLRVVRVLVMGRGRVVRRVRMVRRMLVVRRGRLRSDDRRRAVGARELHQLGVVAGVPVLRHRPDDVRTRATHDHCSSSHVQKPPT